MVGDHSLPPCCTLHLDYCNNVIEIFLKGKMSFLSNLRWKPKKYKWYIFWKHDQETIKKQRKNPKSY